MGAYFAATLSDGTRKSVKIGTNGSQRVLAAAVIAATAYNAPVRERRRMQAWLQARAAGNSCSLHRGSSKQDLHDVIYDGSDTDQQRLNLLLEEFTIERGRMLPTRPSDVIDTALEFYDACQDYDGGPRLVSPALAGLLDQAAATLVAIRGPNDGWAQTVAEAAQACVGATALDIG